LGILITWSDFDLKLRINSSAVGSNFPCQTLTVERNKVTFFESLFNLTLDYHSGSFIPYTTKNKIAINSLHWLLLYQTSDKKLEKWESWLLGVTLIKLKTTSEISNQNILNQIVTFAGVHIIVVNNIVSTFCIYLDQK